MTQRRSAASLLASGAATITLHQRLSVPTVKSTRQALEDDRKAITRDARRVARELSGKLARA